MAYPLVIRPFSGGGEFQAGVKFCYPVEIIWEHALFPDLLGIRFLEEVIKTEAGEFKLLSILGRACRSVFVTIRLRGDGGRKELG